MTDPAPIRLAVVATAEHSVKTLEALREVAGDRIEHIVHLGGKDADYKANNFLRMRSVQGRRGDLMQGDRFTGAASALETGPGMEAALWEAIDNLTRGCCARGSPMSSSSTSRICSTTPAWRRRRRRLG